MNYFKKTDLPMSKEMVNFWNENGFIETTQVILILIALILSLKYFTNSKLKIDSFLGKEARFLE